MRCFVRALFAPSLLVLTLSAGMLVTNAANASYGQGTERNGSRWSKVWDEDGTRTRRVRHAKAVYSDRDAWDDEDDVRPGRRHRTEDSKSRPRYTQRRHKRVAKHHRHRRQLARQHDRRRVAKQGRAKRQATARPSRKATRPAFTKRSLSTAGKQGSGAHGVASYYWQPQRVAAGGWFNPDGMTAAHRSLPFGTRVRVTHVASGRSVEVKINDRGPYIAGRIIDLSRAAAGVIGMTKQGIARVAVEVLGR
jgi:rare lipoprotein A